MRKILSCTLFAVFSLSATLGQSSNSQKHVPPQATQTDPRTAEQQIIDIEKQWSMAFVKRDPSALERYVADDYVGIYPTRKLTKADLIAGAKGGSDRTIVSVGESAPKVRVFDKAAVVTGYAVHHLREKSGEVTVMRTLYTEVFILKDGVWQCVSGHYTPLVSPE